MVEIELKYEIFEKKKDQITKTYTEKQVKDIYYDFKDYTLLKNGNFLRVRNDKKLDFKLDIGDTSHLYCKETSFDLEDFGEHIEDIKKVFETLNIPLSDFSNYEQLIKNNNLMPLAIIDKHRKSYKMEDNITIYYDEVKDIGTFIEAEILVDEKDFDESKIESYKNKLKDFLKKNSIISDNSKQVFIGYVELYLLKHNIEAYNLGKFKN